MRTKFLDDNRIFVVWVDVLFTLVNVCMYLFCVYIYYIIPLFGGERDKMRSVEHFCGGHQVPIFAAFLGLVCRFLCILVPRVENENSEVPSVKASTISGEVKRVLLLSPAKSSPHILNEPPRSLQDLNGSAANLSSGES